METKYTAQTKMAKQDDFIEDVETDHIMPNDNKIPDGLSDKEMKEIKNRPLIIKDLMMIRTGRVKQVLVDDLKVDSSQVTCVAGENLGKGENNQKVILEFY